MKGGWVQSKIVAKWKAQYGIYTANINAEKEKFVNIQDNK